MRGEIHIKEATDEWTGKEIFEIIIKGSQPTRYEIKIPVETKYTKDQLFSIISKVLKTEDNPIVWTKYESYYFIVEIDTITELNRILHCIMTTVKTLEVIGEVNKAKVKPDD